MPTDFLLASRMPALVLALSALLAGGCAAPDAADQSRSADAARAAQAAAAAESARAAAARAQSAGEPQYLRFKADETQLAAVQDDGHLTYLEFASPVTAEVEFFDQDGRQLPMAGAGRVAAISGLHQGVLVRRADRASFVSPNPRALSLPRRPLPAAPDYGEARAKLENQGSQLQAMQRAMEAARAGVPGSSPRPRPIQPPPGSRADQGQPALQSSFHPATQPAMQPAMQIDTTQAPPLSRRFPQLPAFSRFSEAPALQRLPTPLAAANASASAPERGLVRVFFATASRAIVAPDDGLGLLLREAANADEIRVTGFTDATGSRTANDALALARADAVVQILQRRGVPGERIVSSAVGAAEYIADNTSEKGRALNRRVEVLLLRNGVPLAFGAAARAMR